MSRKSVLLTGVGKRYDIVSAFAQHTTTIAADPSPLAPAQYAAHHRVAPPRIDDPGYVPFLAEVCAQHDVGAVIPLTDLDIEVLAQARADGLLPALVPDPAIARATYDKYETHQLLRRHGLPSPPTVLPGEEPESYPVMVKPRRGSAATHGLEEVACAPGAVRVLVAVLVLVRGSLGYLHLAPVGLELIGDNERHSGANSLAHL